MKPLLRIRPRLVLLVLLALLAGIGAYVFTASNTVPDSNAGAGSGTISGYTISSVAYHLDATTPTNIDSITFGISPTAAGTVKIQLVSGGAWYSCANSGGSVTCDTTVGTQATVAPANQLTVVATT
jgi:hypothetical protein